LAAMPTAAQGYHYGYYYPDEQLFVTYIQKPNFQFNFTPDDFAAFTQQYPSYNVRPATTTSFYYEPASSSNALVEIRLPDANGKVWFDGAATSSTGVNRRYQTPTLAAGSKFQYQVKATWMKDGKEISQERVVYVTRGETTVVDFARPANSLPDRRSP